MNFLAVLAALGGEHYLGIWRDARIPGFFDRLLTRLLPTSKAQLVLLVALPALLATLLTAIQPGPFARAVFSGLVLFICLGPRDLAADIHCLLKARASGEADAVALCLRRLQRGPEPEAGHKSLFGALFIASHERVFAPLLWFVAFGPGGALAYRLASLIHGRLPADSPVLDSADTLHGALAWAPTRITALLLALAGSTDDALRGWRSVRAEPHTDWRRQSWSLLAETAAASLDIDGEAGPAVPPVLDDCLREVLRMQNRALLLLLAADALLATGWLAA